MSQEAFTRQSSTVNLAVTASSQTVQCPAFSGIAGSANYRIANIGTQVVFIDFSGSASGTTTTTTGIPLLPNSVEVFKDRPNAYIVAISAGTGSSIYVTAGDGQ